MFEFLDMYTVWPVAVVLLGVVTSVMAWKVMPYVRFAYPTARVQALGNPFVREKELNQLLESGSIKSFKSILNSSRDYNVEGLTAAEVQRSLDEHFVRFVRMVQKDGPRKLQSFYDAYLQMLDGVLVKVALKSKILGKEVFFGSTFFPETRRILEAVGSASLDELVSVLEDLGFDEEVITVLKDGERGLIGVDAAVDKVFLRRIMFVKVPREAKEVRDEFVSRLVDVKNIKNVLRAKYLGYSAEDCEKFFVGEGREVAEWRFKEMVKLSSVSEVVSSLEGTFYFSFLKKELDKYGEKKGVQPLENALDKSLLKVVENLSIKNFPLFGPLLRFIMVKEFEIRNLKTVVKGVEEGFGVERIKPLLILEE